MYDSVQLEFRAFSERFEGYVPYMYLDIKGLVTVGVGNLIDPVELATVLPFRFKSRPGIATPGALASQEKIAAEWQLLKSNPNLAQKGFRACDPLTELDIPDDALNDLIVKRLAGSESFLKRQAQFSAFDNWPADAQLALLSMAWAMGPAGPGRFPLFSAACENLDFNFAAQECQMNEVGNPGLIPRNLANRTLLSNAAVVLAQGLDPSALYYPADLAASDATST
jgi:hypothetical protein